MIAYSLERWAKLSIYARVPRILIDNNPVAYYAAMEGKC